MNEFLLAVIAVSVAYMAFGKHLTALTESGENKFVLYIKNYYQRGRKAGRLEFLIVWIIVNFALPIALISSFGSYVSDDEMVQLLAAYSVAFFLTAPSLVGRAYDMGKSAGFLYWFIVPIANVIVFLMMVFSSHKESDLEQEANPFLAVLGLYLVTLVVTIIKFNA